MPRDKLKALQFQDFIPETILQKIRNITKLYCVKEESLLEKPDEIKGQSGAVKVGLKDPKNTTQIKLAKTGGVFQFPAQRELSVKQKSENLKIDKENSASFPKLHLFVQRNTLARKKGSFRKFHSFSHFERKLFDVLFIRVSAGFSALLSTSREVRIGL